MLFWFVISNVTHRKCPGLMMPAVLWIMRPTAFAILCLAASGQLFAQSTGVHAPVLPSNHALIITVSEYQKSPLPGVLTDRKLGIELAQRKK